MSKVVCNVGDVIWTHKPTKQEVQYHIQPHELNNPVEVEVSVLADRLVHGYNARLSACSSNCDSSFISAEMVGVDFDNESDHPYSPEDVIEILAANGLRACFLYDTWSGGGRFRATIRLSRPTRKRSEQRAITAYIYSLFDDENCDKSTCNESRIFFGSAAGKLIYSDFESMNDTDAILSRIDITPYLKYDSMTGKRTKGKSRKRIKSKLPQQADADVIGAIKRRDAKYLRKRFKREPMVFNNNADFFEYLYSGVSLAEFLGVEESKSFICIFHKEGNEENASAAVIEAEDGKWLYTCRTKNCIANIRAMTIKGVVEKLGDFRSEYRALAFLKEALNISITETDWQVEQRHNIAMIRTAFNNTSALSFDEICPTASKNCRYSRNVYNAILSIAEQNILPARISANDENIIFPMSMTFLTKAAHCSSISKCSAYLKQLQYHMLIRAVPDEELPEYLLKKAHKLQAKSGTKKHITYYMIPSWVVTVTREIESRGIRWKDCGYRLKHLSYEEFYRTEGAEIAAELYPLHKTIITKDQRQIQRTTSKAADERHEMIAETVITLIKSQGYATEKQIIMSCGNKVLTERQVQRSIGDIMQTYNLKKRRLNRELKERLHIESKGYPVVIIPAEGI